MFSRCDSKVLQWAKFTVEGAAFGSQRLWATVFATFADIADIEYAFFGYALLSQCFLEQLRRLENLFLRQNPGAPVDTKGTFASRVNKDINAVEGIRMHRRHDIPLRFNRQHTSLVAGLRNAELTGS